MLEYEEALNQVLRAIPRPQNESIALTEAHGRVLAQRLLAPVDLPGFDNSAMDGYAVRATDVAAATPENPVRLRVAGRIPAGKVFDGEVEAGVCVRLFTGSPLPHGADAVVMQEDVRLEPGPPPEIFVLEAAGKGENVRNKGEDVRQGSVLFEPGQVLSAGALSLLAACGIANVVVGGRPKVALLATGSELKEAGQSLAPGQIFESNRAGLAVLVQKAEGIPRVFPIVTDDLKATRLALRLALDECDIVVTCGGVSVGEMDFVKKAFQEAGGKLEFWRVAMKPGRPFVFGRSAERFFFGLPGNPVSAFVTFLLLVRPALKRWQGATDGSLPAHAGLLAEALANPGERRHFLRVKVDLHGNIYSAGEQASHLLSCLAASNGLVDLPPRTSVPAGATVQVLRWD